MELLWKRLEQAKLDLDLAHNHVKEINQDKLSGAIPLADGIYARGRALQEEESAVGNYLRALHDLEAALTLDEGAGGISEEAHSVEYVGSREYPGGENLTLREREVLRLIASGKSSKQVAGELGIAVSTAVCHRYRLQTKLNAHNTADLTRAALRMGLLEL